MEGLQAGLQQKRRVNFAAWANGGPSDELSSVENLPRDQASSGDRACIWESDMEKRATLRWAVIPGDFATKNSNILRLFLCQQLKREFLVSIRSPDHPPQRVVNHINGSHRKINQLSSRTRRPERWTRAFPMLNITTLAHGVVNLGGNNLG